MRKTVLLLLSSVAIIGCSRISEENANTPVQPAGQQALPEEAGQVPGLMVVQFDDDMLALIEEDLAAGRMQTKSEGLNELLEELGIEEISPVFPEDECPEEFRARERAFGLRNFYYVRYDVQAAPLTKASADLASLPGIVLAEPQNQIAIQDFNDPMLRQQWHYNNTTVKGADVNVFPVWEEYTTGNPDVIVSVVDEGVDLAHEDLAANCIPGGPDGSKNFSTGSYVIDPMSHGTHVAGTIAAVNNNKLGVCGIAGGDAAKGHKGVRIMSCQFFGKNRDGSAADAIRWGANHGAVISQNSWGYIVDINNDGRISADELERAKSLKIGATEKAAVDYFIRYAGCDASGKQKADSPMQGGIVIFAAGNDNIAYGAPANYEKILAVGATDRNARRSDFSNYGDWVDICAPGTQIYSTLPENSYGASNGTSMACPHVSGVAALVVSQCGGSGFTADMLWTKLVNSANPNIIQSGERNIGPLVDAYAAILYGDSGEPGVITDYEVSAQSNNINFSFSVPEDSEGKANYAVMLFASKNRASIANLDPSHPNSDVQSASVLTSTLEVGATATGTIRLLDFEQNYYVTVVPYSYSRTYATPAPVKSVVTDINHAPTAALAEEGPFVRKNYEVFSIPLSIEDPDGHDLTVTYKAGGKADILRVSPYTGAYEIYVTGPDEDAGTFNGKVSVKDAYGLEASLDVSFTLLPNNKPKVISQPENKVLDTPGGSFTFKSGDLFYDEDGEPLSYNISVNNPSVLHAIISNGDEIIVTALRYGVGTITIVATDAKKESAQLSFSIMIRQAGVEVSLYPTPVEDMLYISTGLTEEECEISLYNAAGTLVYKGTQTMSAFNPASINMVKCAPGRYGVTFTYAGKKYNQTVVKK